ncbi:MAG TPA: PhoH family protein [Oligoflexia bacterium]|nr:PhoH family protein [Oligoflexia bacterium]HMP47119.1 PhoH family protein [Oligoflexia bacterium]
MPELRSKIFVLDTSAIITLVQDIASARDRSSPGFAGVLGDNEIIIPRVVLEELDGLRKCKDERSFIASEASRQLEYYTSQGSLLDGIETEKGGVLRFASRPSKEKFAALDLNPKLADHEILCTAIEQEDSLKKKLSDYTDDKPEDELPEVILITQDRILRILARSMYGIKAEELQSVCAPEYEYERGLRTAMLSEEDVDKAIEDGQINLEMPLHINQLVHIVNKDNPFYHYCYGICRDPKSRQVELIDRSKVDYMKVAGEVTGRNVRQKLLLWALMGCGEPDPFAPDGIRLLIVSGPAGSGKSFLTLAAAWERLERGHFDRIVVTRPMVDVGTSLGFLPGTLEEKLKPWGGPIEDNLRAIVQVPASDEGKSGKRGSSGAGVGRGGKPFDAKTWLEMEDRLELVPLTYIRGRTFRKTFVILEEAQNLERGPLKVLLTRLGEGSVVVILGDESQIDNQFLSRRNNGLLHAINSFRSWPQAVHIHLEDIVRSDLAEAASNLL